MKHRLPLLVLVLALVYLVSTLREPRGRPGFDLGAFGRIPILLNGRIKPLDTVARTSLLTLQGRQRVVTPEGKSLSPGEWLADVLYQPDKADTYRHILIENAEVLDLLGLRPEEGDGGKRFSYTQVRARAPELERQGRLAEETEAQLRSPFQRQVITVRNRIVLYLRLKATLLLPDATDPAAEVAALARLAGVATDDAGRREREALSNRLTYMDRFGYFRVVPRAEGDGATREWDTFGAAALSTLKTGRDVRAVTAHAQLASAWRTGDGERFDALTDELHRLIEAVDPVALRKGDFETRFNAAAPFSSSMGLYVLAFLLGVGSWLFWAEPLRRSAFILLAIAFVASSIGIAARMWLEGRPPVTNLYSSALFVGWGAVLLCLVLERMYRNAVGPVAGGMIGLATLLIAHHLSLSGDTMEMMRAVLDSNFWLATHVVVITVGYSAMFLAGFLAIIYIVRGVLTRSLDRGTGEGLYRMVYGVVCFATLFSLTGTVLGGIWADQSWGRFWGWDPKENGALIIVIWSAVMLHARLAGMVRERGFMGMAVFGNIVTSWSWFGTNMLGVGLHSYGFMDAAFYALVSFVVSQLLIIGLCLVPREKWRSAAAR
jgi:ABC-type transport system involved in cytochrome c biogenesis permease subunit